MEGKMKKNLFKSFFLLVIIYFLSPLLWSFKCPVGLEKQEDCPWAGVARVLNKKADNNEDLTFIFENYIPSLLAQIDYDSKNKFLLELWGKSLNYDQFEHSEIVNPEILKFIAKRLGVPAPKGKVVHAGMEHTYGYLFSLLHTRFGFKRARWVRNDIENGLGLPQGYIGPNPPEGSLLLNVSCLTGGIALRDDKVAWNLLLKASKYCPSVIKNYSFSKVKHTRLSEKISLKNGRTVILRTDLVPFLSKQHGNDYLVIYSVYDSLYGRAFLITAFPVSSGFYRMVTNPKKLGHNKKIKTRYNGYVEGVTGRGYFKGTRTVSIIDK
jgi:hypothetical protein